MNLEDRWPDHWSRTVGWYLDAHSGELLTDDDAPLESGRPYTQPWGTVFRSVSHSDPPQWKLRRDHVMNAVTADLIAAAALFCKSPDRREAGSSMSGTGGEYSKLRFPFLDGGLLVEVQLYETMRNTVTGRQQSLITGPCVIRALLEVLGFEQPRRLRGEVSRDHSLARIPGIGTL